MAINREKVLNKAQKQVRKRNWKKALGYYRDLVDDDPDDMRSLLKCGDLYNRLDRDDDALEAYKAVADNYAQDERYQKAIAVYKQAKRINPDDVVLMRAIGECHYRMGRLKDAIRTFNDVQGMYEERGDHDSQRNILERMVQIDPEDVGLRIQLAERYTEDGFKQEALESFNYCARVLEEEGRLDELVQVLERIVYLSPDRHDLRKRLIRMYLDRRDDQQALQHLQICFREIPEDIEVLEMLSQTFERLDRDQKAVMVLEELAPLYERADRQADLENLYRRILRLDPDNQMALEATGADTGPDSGVLAGPEDTGSIGQKQRQQTPPPSDDSLDEVEFLDDDVEFLDEQEPQDNQPVAESTPSGSQGPPQTPPGDVPADPSAPPTPESRADAPSTPSEPPSQPPSSEEAEPVDLSGDVELLDDDGSPEPPVDDGDDIQQIDEIEEIQEIDEIQQVDDVQEVDEIDDVEEIDEIDDVQEIDDVEEIDEIEAVKEIDAEAVDPEAEVREILDECDVFLKYGLYDKAAAAIEEALEAHPESLFAHEQLLELHEETGNTEQRYETLLALAELTRERPAKAYDYLQQALEIAPDPLAVRVKAEALDIDLDGPRPDEVAEDLDEISVEAVEPAEPAEPDEDEPETIHVEVEADDLDEDSRPEPVDEDDAVDAAIDGLDEAFESFADDSADSLSESTDLDDQSPAAPEHTGGDYDPDDAFSTSDDDADQVPEATIPEADTPDFEDDLTLESDSEIVADDELGFEDVDDVEEVDDGDLSLDTDSDIVADDALQFDDAGDVVEMDIDDDAAAFDDSELESLDEESSEVSVTEESEGDVGEVFEDVEADDLFGDLFGQPDETDDADDQSLDFEADDSEGELSEIDFLLEQGLTEEAAEALDNFEDQNPGHPGITERRNKLQQLRSGLSADDDPFGAESLSQDFNPESLESDTDFQQTDADDQPPGDSVVNSNLELGISYREMGLVEEALDEFEQAADDPEAAASARYHIGLCQLDLDDRQNALNSFRDVLQMDEVDPDIEEAARDKLDDLEAHAS